MSTDRSSSNPAASSTYRDDALEGSHIFVRKLELSNCPASVISTANFLTADRFSRTLSSYEVSGFHRYAPYRSCSISTTLWSRLRSCSAHRAFDDVPLKTLGSPEPSTWQDGCGRAFTEAMRLIGAAKQHRGRSESSWMSFARDMFSELRMDPGLDHAEIHLWDEPGGGVILPTPQPDLFFDLSPAQFEGSTAMNRICLKEARAQRQLHPWPSFQLVQVAFPFLIFKCRSDTGTLLFAENEAAGCAAKALTMLRGLDNEGSAGSSLSESIQDLPIIVCCSQAPMWEVFLAFRHTWQGQVDSTHLERVWVGDVEDPWELFRARVIIQRSLLWAKTVFAPMVASRLQRMTAEMRGAPAS
ncbi:unnamed protein product [Jaminaea pallidilutea]